MGSQRPRQSGPAGSWVGIEVGAGVVAGVVVALLAAPALILVLRSQASRPG